MLYDSQKHIVFIDIMKAITIFLVVLGHTPFCSSWLIRWIYAFHMPCFFAIYGMTYDQKSHQIKRWLTWNFIISKVKRLLIPCFIWGMIYTSFSVKNIALVFWGSQASFIRASSLSSLWFLSCMFLTVCFFELLMWLTSRFRVASQKVVLIVTAIVCFFIGYFLPHLNLGYPWCIDVMFPSISFVIVGYGLQNVIKQTPRLNEGRSIIWTALFLLGFSLTLLFIPNLSYVSKNNVDFASRTFGNPVLYVISAVAGIIMLSALSIILCKIKFLQKIAQLGPHSLSIFLLHKPLVLSLSNFLSAKGLDSTPMAILLAICVTALCFFAAKLLKFFVPNLIGVNKNMN